ncbi:hypothetical protein GPECTOR_13g797 [Gonium pectorale]|uniref:TLC domain-containing protein n=1 Tax=Gonium pectorale TaxID=33097 RepID=A0A150GPQ1_GONPE|nr:hypothetical protein GPECTOR_13g797 [Gonium pectorale]|eukprot:KXZ51310.1 hypothetical protein GPECTOR_13g797 [Gonium pectorale]
MNWVAGLSFWLCELVLLALVKPLILATLRNSGGKGDAKTQARKASGTATQVVARLVGTIHNTIQIPLGILILMDARFRNDRVYMSTNLSYAMTYISAGYFFHDLVMCIIRFSLEGPFYLTHALFCCTAYTFGNYSGFLHYHGAAFLMWEISTPFVHTRWFMFKAGLANTSVYVINGILMIIAFFGCRICWGYYETYYLLNDVIGEGTRPGSAFPFPATVGYCITGAIVNCLNTYWFYKMMRAAVAVLVKGKKAEEVSSHKDD